MVGQTAALRRNCGGGETVRSNCSGRNDRTVKLVPVIPDFFGSILSCSFMKGALMFRKLLRDRKGQGLVEYALLVCGIAVISLAAISLLGHKTSDLMGTAATMIPGAHVGDNGPILSGHLIETDNNGQGGSIEVSVGTTKEASCLKVGRTGSA